MPVLPRLRQVALVARDGAAVAATLQETFEWAEPFHDTGVAEFGLTNSVFAAGDTFVEVVSPGREGTTAGRYLDKRGGDSGYMAIFQVGDLAEARDRAAAAGVRMVWTADLPDIATTHLHPADIGGAIVSLDWAEPAGSWRWGGPEWTGREPVHPPGGIRAITVEVADPSKVARLWASLLDVEADGEEVRLQGGEQVVRFAETSAAGEGITEVILSGATEASCTVGSTRVVVEARLR